MENSTYYHREISPAYHFRYWSILILSLTYAKLLNTLELNYFQPIESSSLAVKWRWIKTTKTLTKNQQISHIETRTTPTGEWQFVEPKTDPFIVLSQRKQYIEYSVFCGPFSWT